jgi:hypothetical protein
MKRFLWGNYYEVYFYNSLIFFTISVQTQDYQITLSSGDKIGQISFEKRIGDSVVISHSGQSQLVKIDSIIEIRKIKDSKFWLGAGIGLLGGAVIGGAVGAASYKESDPSPGTFNFDFSGLTLLSGAVLGGFTGSVCGGLIGLVAGRDEVYNLSEKSHMEKLMIIESIKSHESKE